MGLVPYGARGTPTHGKNWQVNQDKGHLHSHDTIDERNATRPRPASNTRSHHLGERAGAHRLPPVRSPRQLTVNIDEPRWAGTNALGGKVALDWPPDKVVNIIRH